METRTREVSRFSNNGKTFFFNRGRAKNDSDFLAINTIYGQGNKERVVLFPSQLIAFHEHLKKATEQILGVTFNEPSLPALPQKCPGCDAHWGAWRVEPNWHVFCDSCGYDIFKPEG